MAKYTVEVSSILSAHAGLLDPRANYQDVDIHGRTYNGETVADYDYQSWDFVFDTVDTPVKIVEKYALDCFEKHAGVIQHNFTNQEDLNLKILDKEIQAFFRHFWGYEIGQENPLYWWNTVRNFFDENQPFFIKAYQKLMIKDEAFITNLSYSTGSTKSSSTGNTVADGTSNNVSDTSSITGNADTPQNELNFSLNTGDPAKDYNFNYSSSVTGAKTHGTNDTTTHNTTDTKNQSEGDSVNNSEARSATVMSLIRELEGFTNGIYLDMWQKAKEYGLFMQVIS